jgi:hypothetical protein
LRQRLKQRNDQADSQTNQHDGHANLEEGENAVAGNIHDLGAGHQIGIRMISS